MLPIGALRPLRSLQGRVAQLHACVSLWRHDHGCSVLGGALSRPQPRKAKSRLMARRSGAELCCSALLRLLDQ